jgi:deazaflavin-dependent oxidoreductase (nitroreductase family)
MQLLIAFEERFIKFQTRIYEKTDGRLGHRLAGVPCLLLGTTGRKTGLPRRSTLLYVREGDDVMVVGSNNGKDAPPAWLLNIRAQPKVQVQIGRQHFAALAREVAPGDEEYERRWDVVNKRNHGRYRKYQTRTERPISVVVFRSVGS